MDQNGLVESGNQLIDGLSQSGVGPRAAMWINNAETDTWRLWIVPPKQVTDKREFYRKVAEVISKDRQKFANIDAGDVDMIPDTHPAIVGMRKMFNVTGRSNVFLKNNMINGFYIPDGILLLLNL